MTFPNRITRTSMGPHMVDEKRVTSPVNEVGADVVNLSFWQAAGISRVLPLVSFNYDAGVANYLMAAWATTQYGYRDTAGVPAAANLVDSPYVSTVTVLGDNRVEVQFVDQVTDMAGAAYDLNFTFGTAIPANTAVRKGSAVISTGPGGRTNLVTIGVASAAGTFHTHEVAVSLW